MLRVINHSIKTDLRNMSLHCAVLITVTLYWVLFRFLLFRRFTVLLTLGMEKESDSSQREEMRNNGTLLCFTFIPFLGC